LTPATAASGVRWLPVEIPAQPAWRRALAERRLLPRLLGELGATCFDHALLPVPRRLPCPTVLTIHDLRDLGPHRRRPLWLTRRLLRSGMRRVAHVVVPSEATGRALRAALGGLLPPLSVIPNAADPVFFGAARQPGFDPPYFLHVGHLEPRKNPMLLLSAFAQIAGDWPDGDDAPPRLKCVGADHGSRRELAERAAMLEITPHVDFLGQVPDAELATLYAGAAAVLVPSLEEGFGLAALEGLAAGRPVLVSDRGALADVVGGQGRVLPAEDASAWAAAMRTALREGFDGPDRAARIARARSFSWDSAAEQLLSIWRC
jgi:glycosyltransferase involved in cell wall biosynthesis